MRKLFNCLLMLSLLLMLSVDCFAISRGKAYTEDNGYYDEEIKTAAPGDKIYIAITQKSDEESDFEIKSTNIPKTAKITSMTTIGFIDDKKYKLISTGEVDIESEEVADGIEWYFAVIPVKSYDIEKFPEDGCSIEGKLKITRKSGKSFTIDLGKSLDSISFSEANSRKKLEKEAQLYRFDTGDKISLEFPNGKGRFTATAKKDINVTAGMNHTKISSITRQNDDVNMVFFRGNGAKFDDVRKPKLIIDADDDWYLYEIKSGNSLRDRSDYYDDDENAFVIETNVLGSYVIADEPLDYDDDDYDDDDDKDDEDDYEYAYIDDGDDEDYNDDDDYDFVLINPTTGAAV